MVDSVGASLGASATNATPTQLSTAGAKIAKDVQEQEGQNVQNLLQTTVAANQGSTGNQIDVTA